MSELVQTQGKHAYATLLTRPSYLAGALLLAHTLYKHSPSTPLIILYPADTLTTVGIEALKAESKHSNIILRPVDHLRLPNPAEDQDTDQNGGMVAERFIDTWTKLRVFELDDLALDLICFLDADMMIFKDPSPAVFSDEVKEYVGGGDANRIMATHVCVCNLDHDSWAPSLWTPENCAYTGLNKVSAPPPVTTSPATKGIFNSGTFVFRPTTKIRNFVFHHFEGEGSLGVKKLRAMKFPDQDFLNEVFNAREGRWNSLPWNVNALKTWRYWHSNMWSDQEVRVLHYIVDKPWAKRVGPDGKAGYKGDDGETHSWWWRVYEAWRKERTEQGDKKLVETTDGFVASIDGKQTAEMRAIGGGAQDFAKKWEDKSSSNDSAAINNDSSQPAVENEDDFGKKENGTYGEGPNGPILRKPMLGERGHGPVAKGFRHALGGRGRGMMDP